MVKAEVGEEWRDEAVPEGEDFAGEGVLWVRCHAARELPGEVPPLKSRHIAGAGRHVNGVRVVGFSKGEEATTEEGEAGVGDKTSLRSELGGGFDTHN